MSMNQVLRWLDGSGWIVLSAQENEYGSIRATALERASSIGDVIYISFASDAGDALMDDMEDLGAPTGYLVDINNESNESIRDLIKDACLVVIEAGENIDECQRGLLQVESILREVYQHGVVLLLEGRVTSLFGRWYVDDEGHLVEGLNWITNAYIVPASAQSGDDEVMKYVLAQHPDTIGIGIGTGSALALGPQLHVDLWGRRNVTVSLGANYSSD